MTRERVTIKYECEGCGKFYLFVDDAEKCEQSHEPKPNLNPVNLWRYTVEHNLSMGYRPLLLLPELFELMKLRQWSAEQIQTGVMMYNCPTASFSFNGLTIYGPT